MKCLLRNSFNVKIVVIVTEFIFFWIKLKKGNFALQRPAISSGFNNQGLEKGSKKLTFANIETVNDDESHQISSAHESTTNTIDNTTNESTVTINSTNAFSATCAPPTELNVSTLSVPEDLDTTKSSSFAAPSTKSSQQSLHSSAGSIAGAAVDNTSTTSKGGGGVDLSLQKYKARLVKNSRLMAKRLLPSRHRYKNSFLSRPSHKQVIID